MSATVPAIDYRQLRLWARQTRATVDGMISQVLKATERRDAPNQDRSLLVLEKLSRWRAQL